LDPLVLILAANFLVLMDLNRPFIQVGSFVFVCYTYKYMLLRYSVTLSHLQTALNVL
jgi:hypothetical protein